MRAVNQRRIRRGGHSASPSRHLNPDGDFESGVFDAERAALRPALLCNETW